MAGKKGGEVMNSIDICGVRTVSEMATKLVVVGVDCVGLDKSQLWGNLRAFSVETIAKDGQA